MWNLFYFNIIAIKDVEFLHPMAQYLHIIVLYSIFTQFYDLSSILLHDTLSGHLFLVKSILATSRRLSTFTKQPRKNISRTNQTSNLIRPSSPKLKQLTIISLREIIAWWCQDKTKVRKKHHIKHFQILIEKTLQSNSF